jgi:flagellar biosynthesis protein FlhB
LSIPFAVTLHFTKPLINHLPEIIQLSILIVLAITVYFLTVLSVLRLLINTNPYYKFVFEFSFKFIDPILNRLKRLKDNK